MLQGTPESSHTCMRALAIAFIDLCGQEVAGGVISRHGAKDDKVGHGLVAQVDPAQGAVLHDVATAGAVHIVGRRPGGDRNVPVRAIVLAQRDYSVVVYLRAADFPLSGMIPAVTGAVSSFVTNDMVGLSARDWQKLPCRSATS